MGGWDGLDQCLRARWQLVTAVEKLLAVLPDEALNDDVREKIKNVQAELDKKGFPPSFYVDPSIPRSFYID